jgi:hypothetical protein
MSNDKIKKIIIKKWPKKRSNLNRANIWNQWLGSWDQDYLMEGKYKKKITKQIF